MVIIMILLLVSSRSTVCSLEVAACASYSIGILFCALLVDRSILTRPTFFFYTDSISRERSPLGPTRARDPGRGRRGRTHPNSELCRKSLRYVIPMHAIADVVICLCVWYLYR